MKSEYYRHDKTNAIQLRAIYDIGVGIAKSFINSKSEEVFLWNEHIYGEWPLDTKRKEIKSILNNLGDEQALQPWFHRLQHHKEIQIVEAEEVTKSGLVLPDSAQEKPQQAEIVAVGPGKLLDDGTVKAVDVKAGDRVLYGKYSGTEIKVDGEDLLILREDEILAVVEA